MSVAWVTRFLLWSHSDCGKGFVMSGQPVLIEMTKDLVFLKHGRQHLWLSRARKTGEMPWELKGPKMKSSSILSWEISAWSSDTHLGMLPGSTEKWWKLKLERNNRVHPWKLFNLEKKWPRVSLSKRRKNDGKQTLGKIAQAFISRLRRGPLCRKFWNKVESLN